MPTRPDIHNLLRSYGILPTLKGHSSLVNLILLTTEGHPCDRNLLRAQAKQEKISLSILLGRLNYAQRVFPETFFRNSAQRFDGVPSPYRLILFLAYEANKAAAHLDDPLETDP